MIEENGNFKTVLYVHIQFLKFGTNKMSQKFYNFNVSASLDLLPNASTNYHIKLTLTEIFS